MLLGLPTLYDTEFGRSGAGTYGLMDQGSNAGSGLCPIKPSAFERYLLGAVEPITISGTGSIKLLRDEVYKLPISSNEYFLIEFRKNSGLWADSLMWARDDVEDYLDVLRVMDSLDLVDYTLQNGVLTDISDLDLALPTDGLLIWHIVEPEFFGENPNAQDNWFLNLVEADGGDDIGKWYGTFDPSVNNGWKWDMWFEDNPAYEDNNPSAYKMQFNNNSHPNTRSKAGLPSGINIHDFDFYADSVIVQLIMESETAFNFDGVVFDEMTNAFQYVLPDPKQLLGYRDSSIVLFDGDSFWEIYKHDTAYVKGQTAFLSYPNSLIQITNTETSSDVSFLANTGGLLVLSEFNSTHISHPIDLEHVAIYGDTLFLPPLSPEFPYADTDFPEQHEAFIVDIPSWTFSKYIDTEFTLIPFLHPYYNTVSSIAGIDFSAIVNPDDDQFSYHVYSQDNGFYYNLGNYTIDPYPKYAEEFIIRSIIPIHMNDDDQFEVLSLAEINGENTLAAFTRTGELLDNFPIFENYEKLRVYYLHDEPQIVAYNPDGVIDIYSKSAELLQSFPAPVNASTLFLEQVSSDTAWIVSDGSIIEIPSDFVYWGYDGKDAAYTNSVYLEKSNIPVVSDKLIKNGLVYNYPNPIEGERTKFRLFATGATNAVISIYSLDGRFITRLEKTLNDQQWNEILWNVENEESGVYLAKVEVYDLIKTETYFVKPAILK